MSKIKNPWLNPLQRSYQQIKTKLIEALINIKGPDGKTLVTDYSEGNLLIIILSLFSAIAEVLHYYIDNMARETFFSTARRYESLVKHARLVDYNPKGATAASVEVIITRSSDDTSNASNIDIPIMDIEDSAGNLWRTVKPTIWYANTNSVSISLIQHKPYIISELLNLVIPTQDNPIIKVPSMPPGNFYEQGSMVLRIGSDNWTLVDTFAYSTPSDKHFIVKTDSSQNVVIIFGDGRFGSKPEPGLAITSCGCFITAGASGNVESGFLTTVPSTISMSVPTASCTNPYKATGGSNYEDFNSLKTRIPLSTRTMGVAITKQDFIDLALTIGGVSKAALEYECGRKLNLYIAGIGGTTASQSLCTEVYNYISQRALLTTWLTVSPAGTSEIILNLNITGKKGFSTEDIRSQVVNALMDKYSAANSEIGRGVRMSDMYALLDNLSMVDYLTINEFYLKPWPKTIYGKAPLVLSSYKLTKSPLEPVEYLVTFTSSINYSIVSKDGQYRSTGEVGKSITFNDQYHDTKFSWTTPASTQQSGDRYSVVISKSNTDVDNIGYNLAVFDDPTSQLVLTVNETI